MTQRILSASQFRALMQGSTAVDFHEHDVANKDPNVLAMRSGETGGHARPTNLDTLSAANVSASTVRHPENELS